MSVLRDGIQYRMYMLYMCSVESMLMTLGAPFRIRFKIYSSFIPLVSSWTGLTPFLDYVPTLPHTTHTSKTTHSKNDDVSGHPS
jgi:hypothetical protein